MPDWMDRRRVVPPTTGECVTDRKILICLLLLILAVLLNLPVPSSMRVESAVRSNMEPLQNGMWFLIGRARHALAFLSEAEHWEEDRQHLLEKVRNLESEVQTLNGLRQENDSLRREIGFRNRSRRRLVLCEVTSRGDASGWWQTITLNRGALDGIRPNMAVVSSQGPGGSLIGKTTDRVSGRTCDALLITDPTCRVACKLPRIGAFGILRGAGVAFNGDIRLEVLCSAQPCRLDYIQKEVPIQEGDAIVTSGLGGVYPEGLLVGQVIRSTPDPSGLYQRLDVRPEADMGNLKYVFAVVE
jgi:rod shape-determining protein MreC